MGPMPAKAKARVGEWLETLTDPAFSNFEERLQLLADVRGKFAKLLGASPENIALGGSVSELVGHVANGIEIHQGDNVILMENDFPSMILPWMVVSELKGFHVSLLPREYFLDPSKLAGKIDDRTRFAGCSHVMFNTGIKLPVAEIGKVCREREILFLADTSQSFGAIRIAPDVLKNVDILVGVAYKWLLGPYGSAYGYFSDRALKEVRRTHASWAVSANMRSTESLLDYTTETLPGALKFDRGEAPTYLINAALDGALDTILEKGLGKIEEHNMDLARHFLANLPQGFQTFSTRETLSPIVCFKSPKEDSPELKRRLAAEGIDLTIREGYLRASFHFFNTKKEVDRLLAAL
jgi:selenocysteine lyase/cysteine desulfurase